MNNEKNEIWIKFLKKLKSQKEIPTTEDFEKRFFDKIDEQNSKSESKYFIPKLAVGTAVICVIAALILLKYMPNKDDNFTLKQKYEIDSSFVASVDSEKLYNAALNNIGNNFNDNEKFEGFLTTTINNYNFFLESPKIGEKISRLDSIVTIKASLDNKDFESIRLNIFIGSNQNPILSKVINSNSTEEKIKIDHQFELILPGKYYWELLNENERIFTGKFFWGDSI